MKVEGTVSFPATCCRSTEGRPRGGLTPVTWGAGRCPRTGTSFSKVGDGGSRSTCGGRGSPASKPRPLSPLGCVRGQRQDDARGGVHSSCHARHYFSSPLGLWAAVIRSKENVSLSTLPHLASVIDQTQPLSSLASLSFLLTEGSPRTSRPSTSISGFVRPPAPSGGPPGVGPGPPFSSEPAGFHLRCPRPPHAALLPAEDSPAASQARQVLAAGRGERGPCPGQRTSSLTLS